MRKFPLTSLGDLAKEISVPPWTLQYRLKRGDLPPGRTSAGRRFFDSKEVEEIKSFFERRKGAR